MRTSALIDALATGAGAAPRAVAARRLIPVAMIGALASTLLAAATIGIVPDFAALGAALWIKLVYAFALVLAAGWLTARVARPAAGSQAARVALGGIVLAMALIGWVAYWQTAPDRRMPDLLGHSWSTCPWAVLGLSIPALFATLHAVRGLAPTRPFAAGLAAGLTAGALGAFGYAFACLEVATPFIALWYTLGIAMAGALGAALGPRWLRW